MTKTYKIGDITKHGDEIVEILACQNKHIIFKNQTGNLKWSTDCDDETISRTTRNVHEISKKIPSNLPKNITESIQSELGTAMLLSFICSDIEEIDDYFKHLDQRVSNLLSPDQAKLWLVLFNLTATILLTLVLFIFSYISEFNLTTVIFCGLSGILGSTFSLMQRNTNISINLEHGKGYIFLQAAYISVLGMLSGFCLYLLSRSELAFSFASDNNFNLYTLSIISGFSERFIPDLFQKTKNNV